MADMAEEYKYKKLVEDTHKIKQAHGSIADALKQTFSQRFDKFGRVLTDICHYTGLIEIGGGKALALRVDGVGPKTLIAQAMKKYDTIGIDCVAANVNDLVCMGAEPVTLVDYLSLEKADEKIISEIMKGLTKAAKEAGVAVVGGDTAVLPDTVKGFNLAAMSIGVVYRDKIMTNEKIRPGNIIIGLESPSINTEGISLAKKVLLQRYDIGTHVKELDCSVGEELLKPAKIYVKPVLEILQNCKINGLAHINTGGLSKLVKLAEKANVGLEIKLPKPVKPVFKLVQHHGLLSDGDMFKAFNMGIGFIIIVSGEDPEDYERVADVLKKYGIKHEVIGKVTEMQKVVVNGVELT
jgi:phosphoribosylformylglycinamidine cyclo-ligase